MDRVVGSSVVEMQVIGEDGDALLVDLKKEYTSLSLREHLVFMELARQDEFQKSLCKYGLDKN